jgi:hypothetical protein
MCGENAKLCEMSVQEQGKGWGKIMNGKFSTTKLYQYVSIAYPLLGPHEVYLMDCVASTYYKNQ